MLVEAWRNHRHQLFTSGHALVPASVELDIAAVETIGNVVTREQDSAWLVLAKWLRKLVEQKLKDHTTLQRSVSIENMP